MYWHICMYLHSDQSITDSFCYSVYASFLHYCYNHGRLCVCRESHCDMAMMHTLTAVPRSTQLSTVCETVKWVSDVGLSHNNKWQWWAWILAAFRWTRCPSWSACPKGRQPLDSILYSSGDPWELFVIAVLWWCLYKYCRQYCYCYYYNHLCYLLLFRFSTLG